MSPKKILLVEDNPSDIALTRRAFQRSHIANELLVVEDGQEALDFLFRMGAYKDKAADDLPALVLLDLKLPKVSGLEVLRQLRQDTRTRLMPVVILTSSAEERDILTGYELGVNSYIRKPVDFAQFSAAMVNLGLYWLVLNEPPPNCSVAVKG